MFFSLTSSLCECSLDFTINFLKVSHERLSLRKSTASLVVAPGNKVSFGLHSTVTECF